MTKPEYNMEYAKERGWQSMEITYRETRKMKPEDVARVFRTSRIRRPHQDLERLDRMIRNANLVITAWDGGKMVGIARAVTDFAYCCYLSDLAVDEAYQGHGIGRELVNKIREKAGEECALILIAAPEAVDYYPKIGFAKSNRAFIIPRTR